MQTMRSITFRTIPKRKITTEPHHDVNHFMRRKPKADVWFSAGRLGKRGRLYYYAKTGRRGKGSADRMIRGMGAGPVVSSVVSSMHAPKSISSVGNTVLNNLVVSGKPLKRTNLKFLGVELLPETEHQKSFFIHAESVPPGFFETDNIANIKHAAETKNSKPGKKIMHEEVKSAVSGEHHNEDQHSHALSPNPLHVSASIQQLDARPHEVKSKEVKSEDSIEVTFAQSASITIAQANSYSYPDDLPRNQKPQEVAASISNNIILVAQMHVQDSTMYVNHENNPVDVAIGVESFAVSSITPTHSLSLASSATAFSSNATSAVSNTLVLVSVSHVSLPAVSTEISGNEVLESTRTRLKKEHAGTNSLVFGGSPFDPTSLILAKTAIIKHINPRITTSAQPPRD